LLNDGTTIAYQKNIRLKQSIGTTPIPKAIFFSFEDFLAIPISKTIREINRNNPPKQIKNMNSKLSSIMFFQPDVPRLCSDLGTKLRFFFRIITFISSRKDQLSIKAIAQIRCSSC
jgi:hypothetical protein